MAQYNILVDRGGHAKDATYGTGAPVLTADSVAVTFDRTNSLTRGEAVRQVREILKFMESHSWPPV